MVAVAVVFSIGGLVMGSFLEPKRHSRAKLKNYEYDVKATPAASEHGRSSVKYYLTTMTFIVFDIEVTFLYPWAIPFHKLSLFGVVATLSFVFPIAVPSVYERYHGGPE